MRIAVIIPCYRVRRHILGVLKRIGPSVDRIFVVDDCCPEFTGKLVQTETSDPRVRVLFNEKNRGVGGAVVRGYEAALEEGMDIAVKLDGDGQMDPERIPVLVAPILAGNADYTKGNRFFALEFLTEMPALRLVGNAALSFVSKAASGYWGIMDPTNGFTAVHCSVLKLLPLGKLDERYFFESDMLFRLNTVRAVVKDVPMPAQYRDEKSSLKISRVLGEFPVKYGTRFMKRVFYNYILRDFNLCSLLLIAGFGLTAAGALFGGYHWYLSSYYGVVASSGTIMLAGLPIILGFQSLLAAAIFDVTNVPSEPLSPAFVRTKAIIAAAVNG